MIINISDVWVDAAEEHVSFLNSVIAAGLKDLGRKKLDRKISKFIKDNQRIITNGTANELVDSINNFESVFNGGDRTAATKKLYEIFNYENFSKKNIKKWSAYTLCKKARHTICCYCHLATTETFLPGKQGRGYRPPIDHYYAKSVYPFLSLTLSNFIPSCERCNGTQMKGQTDFYKVRHLNPLTDEESIEFFLNSRDPGENGIVELMSLNLPKGEYCLELKVIKNQNLSDASIETFQLASRYQHYSEQAFHLARKARDFVARKNEMDSKFDFKVSLEDILEFEPERYKTHVYGKARLCIAEQFCGAIN